MVSLKKSISLNFFSQIINLFAGFGVSIIISRLLGPAGRGEYVLVITSASFIVQFFMFGIESSTSHYVAAKKVDLSKLLSTVIISILIIFLLTFLTIWFPPFFSLFIPDNNSKYADTLLILCLLMFVNSIYSSILSGAKLFQAVIFIGTIAQILSLLSCLTIFFFSSRFLATAEVLLNLLAAVYFITAIAYTYVYLRFIKTAPSWTFMNTKELKSFFTFSFISFVCSVLQFLSYRMDFWIVNYYWGATNLGVYSLASSLSQLLWILPQSIATIMFPMTSYYDRSKLMDITNRLLRVSLFLSILIVTPLLIAAPFFINFLFGKEFYRAAIYFQIFLFGIFPFVLIKIFASVFAGMGRVKYNLLATLVGFLSGSLIYLILIPRMGPIGGVIGSIVSYLLTTTVGVYFYRKEFNVEIRDLLILKKSDVRYIITEIKTLKR